MNKNYDIIETCPHCDGYINITTDDSSYAINHNYKIICPFCGKEIFLCDECMHAEDNPTANCNWSERGCFRGKTNN